MTHRSNDSEVAYNKTRTVQSCEGTCGQWSLPEAFPKPGYWDGASFPLMDVYNGCWYQFIGSMRQCLVLEGSKAWVYPCPSAGCGLEVYCGQDKASKNLPDPAWNGHKISQCKASVKFVSGKIKALLIWRGLQISFNLILKNLLRMNRKMNIYVTEQI